MVSYIPLRASSSHSFWACKYIKFFFIKKVLSTKNVYIFLEAVFKGFFDIFLYSFLFLKTWIAVKTASLNELSSAIPLPAISKAVPWSGEVLTLDRPAVKFTPSPNVIVLKGINP